MKPITILLAEDHTVVREGLRALLASERDIEVIGEAETGREAVRRTKELRPNVVVIDIAMPLLNGLEATRQILQAVPGTRVLVLSAHADDDYVEEVLALGATGYLLKQTSSTVLAEAIRAVHNGRMYFCASIARRLEEIERNAPPHAAGRPRTGAPRLTSREVEVLQLIAEGLANKQAAAELGISIKTVEKHRQHVMSKLGLHDTAGLTRYAITAGIVEGGVRLSFEADGTSRRPASTGSKRR